MIRDTEVTEVTEVIFRKEQDGSILAVFPYIIHHGCTVTCYAHIGQHSACLYDEYAIGECKPATETEYRDLFNELENNVGYKLKVIKRRNYNKYLKAYRANIQQYRAL
tara:strand:+ start:3164 stop:3487 length:324 start_codon:yes stop_codon:yes gene_type:complete